MNRINLPQEPFSPESPTFRLAGLIRFTYACVTGFALFRAAWYAAEENSNTGFLTIVVIAGAWALSELFLRVRGLENVQLAILLGGLLMLAVFGWVVVFGMDVANFLLDLSYEFQRAFRLN